MNNEKGWLNEIFKSTEKELEKWPNWMVYGVESIQVDQVEKSKCCHSKKNKCPKCPDNINKKMN